MRWNRLTYRNGMIHTVSDDLLSAVYWDMQHAMPPGVLQETADCDEVGLERGGMYTVGCPWESTSLAGLRVEVRSQDLDELLQRWRVAPRVSALGRDFYRFTGWPWHCLAVDPDQRAALLGALAPLVESAGRRVVKFYAGRPSPQEVLQAHNESRGLHIPYGPDPIEKLRS
jgi:hypothetical protein